MIADYWRYLAIWEYGGTPNYLKNFVATTMKLTDLLLTGIYTDMDNAPGSSFNNGTVIADEYDAFFEVERDGFPSQYFFAGKFINGVLHKET
jgi:mannosyltransferase OCH1-like enzyme